MNHTLNHFQISNGKCLLISGEGNPNQIQSEQRYLNHFASLLSTEAKLGKLLHLIMEEGSVAFSYAPAKNQQGIDEGVGSCFDHRLDLAEILTTLKASA